MKTVTITGTAGSVGSESVKPFAREGFEVVGMDNDLRQWFFGKAASALANRRKPIQSLPDYQRHDRDIRDRATAENLFKQPGRDISKKIHHVCPAP